MIVDFLLKFGRDLSQLGAILRGQVVALLLRVSKQLFEVIQLHLESLIALLELLIVFLLLLEHEINHPEVRVVLGLLLSL